jgi:hypothetical protein
MGNATRTQNVLKLSVGEGTVTGFVYDDVIGTHIQFGYQLKARTGA